MIILDRMIRAGRFAEFVQEVMRIRNKEMMDQARWEYWLHRVFEMSYENYLAMFDNADREETLPEEVLTATVEESMGIINDFCPS